MTEYIHKVQYYETDAMGITHHANYIRWMEEARTKMLEEIGWSYDTLEKMGVVSPVTGIQCDYKESTTYPDRVAVHSWVRRYTGVRLVVEYEMRKCEGGALVFRGQSEHCFLDGEGKVVRLKRQMPEFHQALTESLKKGEKPE